MCWLRILKAGKSSTKETTPGWVLLRDHMESRKVSRKQDGKRGLYNGRVLASFMST